MNKTTSFLDVNQSVFQAYAQLAQLLDAMQVLEDVLEAEAYQSEKQFDETNAIIFAKRFPMHLSLFRIIQNGVSQVVDELDRLADLVCEMSKGKDRSIET